MLELIPSYTSSFKRLEPSDLERQLTEMFFGPMNSTPSFPKYNIYRMLDGNPYVHFMEFALAGYSKEHLVVKMDGEHLVVSGKADSRERAEREYSHRGMARRDFSSRFHVGKNIEVRSARFADGLLTIELERMVPEEQRPRPIEIE